MKRFFLLMTFLACFCTPMFSNMNNSEYVKLARNVYKITNQDILQYILDKQHQYTRMFPDYSGFGSDLGHIMDAVILWARAYQILCDAGSIEHGIGDIGLGPIRNAHYSAVTKVAGVALSKSFELTLSVQPEEGVGVFPFTYIVKKGDVLELCIKEWVTNEEDVWVTALFLVDKVDNNSISLKFHGIPESVRTDIFEFLLYLDSR